MIRGQWVSYVSIFAFAISVAHSIFPHTHPKEEGKNHKHHTDNSTSHSHKKSDHHNSHSDDSPQLPVFTHVATSDVTVSPKQSYSVKQLIAIEFEGLHQGSPIFPVLPDLPAPIPYSRDLPQGLDFYLYSLRAPPFSIS